VEEFATGGERLHRVTVDSVNVAATDRAPTPLAEPLVGVATGRDPSPAAKPSVTAGRRRVRRCEKGVTGTDRGRRGGSGDRVPGEEHGSLRTPGWTPVRGAGTIFDIAL
jgi:hypothetical protein